MESSEKKALQAFAVRIRMALVEAIHSIGSGHVGGALSIADVLAVLYGREMNVRPEDPQWPDRDYLVVSKGHAGPAVYGTLALKGYFPYEELKTLNQGGTRLPSHCDRNKTPGIDVTTGSLGQGTSQAADWPWATGSRAGRTGCSSSWATASWTRASAGKPSPSPRPTSSAIWWSSSTGTRSSWTAGWTRCCL